MTQAKSKKWVSKTVMVGLVALGIVAFRYFDLGQYLSLEYIKASQAKFHTLYLSHRFIVIAAYMGIYIAVTALSLPGAAVLTLAGGGLFGLILGTVVVSFASSIGATLACFVSRFILQEWVQNKFGEKLTTINDGIEKEGAFYLFSLRLVPIFPFLSATRSRCSDLMLPSLRLLLLSGTGSSPGAIQRSSCSPAHRPWPSDSSASSPSFFFRSQR